MRLAIAVLIVPVAVLAAPMKPPQPEYVKKGTRAETIRAALAAAGLPNLEGAWHYAGPFDNTDGEGFDFAYPPEKGVDLKATYAGKNGEKVAWKAFPKFELGRVLNLAALFPNDKSDAVVYLYHEFTADRAFSLPVSLGSDDTVSVFFNGKRIYHENHVRPAAPDQDRVDLTVRAGTNTLLLKVCQYAGGWEVYVAPENSTGLAPTISKRIDRDFPPPDQVRAAAAADGAESKHYAVSTFPLPTDCVLEVGGLAFRPDGRLLVCTRRGEVWLVHNPTTPNPAEVRMTRFATGLHEPLGLSVVDNHTTYVVQRPELTRMTDRNSDEIADEFVTVCDDWGVSGDYHEFAFGPARDRDGHFFVTLNVGFGGGHQAKAAWRGWCVRVSPSGRLEPWAYGLRSPNGVTIAPDGGLFYCDNQGEWVATNKMNHIRPGGFYGHQAGLKWVPMSPFAGQVGEQVASGMWYDGTNPKNPNGPRVYPAVDPPCVWFPYGRMGQSISEPVWDTTGGRFGPFAGQCFVGDQTRSMVMRVALETVNGVYQGAALPFRSGLQCGVNRMAFGPDGSLYVGQTNRGWGSVGGKPYGLQRISFTGEVPFEIQRVELLNEGFRLTFTKPLDAATARAVSAYAVKSWTYVYESRYGCPETDTRAEAVTATALAADGRSATIAVPGLRKGRVYEIRLDGVKSTSGDTVLHPEAYYTLNELVQ